MVSYVNVLLYGVGGIVFAGMALLVAFQERLVYVPVVPGLTKSYPITPARLRLTYEDVWLRSSDGVRLHAWFIKLFPDCRGPTILFFQENAGSILLILASGFGSSIELCTVMFLLTWMKLKSFSLNYRLTDIAHRLEMVRIMLQKLQCNVFMLSYRGYGASDGIPSQQGITKDAQAAFDHLCQRSDIDTSRIVVFGRSLGGAVGALLTRNNPEKDLDAFDDYEWESQKDAKHQRSRENTLKVYKFLSGLNDDFDEVRGRVIARKPLPSIGEAYSEVRREESRRKLMLVKKSTSVANENSTFKVNKSQQTSEALVAAKHGGS
ncbi:Alpha/beta hydrolase domain-containing protein WAV2 [Linum perenne]